MNELYVWCMMNWGHLPDSRYTGTLQKQSEVSMCALWMSAIGSTAPRDQEEWRRVAGWSGAAAMLLWTEWVCGARSTRVSALWQCEVGAGRERTCLSGTQTGGAASVSPTVCGPGFRPVSGPGLIALQVFAPFDPDAPRSLYDRSFFGVFWCSY